MVNITHKSDTLRKATATAIVQLSNIATVEAIKHNQVPKGDVFSFAKVAAFFAIKKTSDMIPDCHPLPVEYSDVRFAINDLQIQIEVEVHTIYKTGVEVEAMHGASIAALTLYDMLKPLDKGIEILQVKLLEKTGGKSDKKWLPTKGINAAVIVCSDSVFQQKATDKAGLAFIEKLKTHAVETTHYEIVPDESIAIEQVFQKLIQDKISLLIFVGGTGVSPRDISVETIRPLLDKELPGVMETARSYGQERMPFAMLSRSIAGTVGDSLVLCLPGSTNAAKEYADALFPQVLHVFNMLDAAGH
ncbi:MAG: bifunctional molybdenum cofactor biosynthesis protein MoaC/MoaB [Bacteroidetes bacterium 24-39-8]|jgi:molybdenum cofactor biosynthesis protein MoaC|nr:MAG: bifunctional molybdenum cofactor biosynthesis protein MoaC/MoaB [Sphingobacteriia bacterium 35-40-8]OYZ51675.1 MAG: bifunctional molybdenum cofactor biosynthesis protein MoaC/MoaB [Bacteroidetes bacterium 24-39-8]HQR93850.1 bifunctional molybdenum cofactor biosynthesis protein MoaC/MoaB [Sediminibacterium sp.]HQS55119.1 bifunctional molybdenum cofactor biosynthesis protein MoaC/MoaB [Sediminibacterium sp.]